MSYNNVINFIELVEGWKEGHYLEVAEELKSMNCANLLEFLILFVKDNGVKEIEILKKFIE